MRHVLTAAAIGVVCFALSVPAYAQEGTVTGAAGGAVTGAIIGGPVGAAVGGVSGAIVGTVIAPPREHGAYVIEPRGGHDVIYDRRVQKGERLPENVVVYEVPDSDQGYGYTIINERRYIVDPYGRVAKLVDE